MDGALFPSVSGDSLLKTKPFVTVYWLVVAFVFLFASLPASAKNAPWLAVTEHFPPYNFENGNRITGFSTDLVFLLAKQADIEVDVQIMPWSRAMLTANNNPNVLIFSMLRTPLREANYHWIGEVDNVSIYIWKRKGSYALKGEALVYGTARSLDASNTDILASELSVSRDKVIEVETGEQLVGLLVKERVDRILMAENVWNKVKQTMPVESLRKLQRVQLLTRKSLFIAASIESDQSQVAKWQRAFEGVKANRSYEALRKQYRLD